MLNGGFYPENCSFDKEPYLRYKYREYKDLCDAYRMVWNDAEYFPVASKEIFFEDDWIKSEKNDGKDQKRAGCDLFGKCDQADFYPIISMTDGRIEEIGWIPSDGYRIGIRAPSGGYFSIMHISPRMSVSGRKEPSWMPEKFFRGLWEIPAVIRERQKGRYRCI